MDADRDINDMQELASHLPFLRRYARALTGSQSSGDAYAAMTLEAILEGPEILDLSLSPKVALFSAFHQIWKSVGSPVSTEEAGLKATAQKHLSKLGDSTREALLLHTIEEFSFNEIASIMDTDTTEVEDLVARARQDMEDAIAGCILIIEDEAIIAMDIEALVADMGHRVAGVARTHQEAVQLGKSDKPDLILADIHLADNSSGIDAVNDLIAHFGPIPAIFITAYPERLLTGERPEPAFLIAKPYRAEQLRSAISQAMFFASTETLTT